MHVAYVKTERTGSGRRRSPWSAALLPSGGGGTTVTMDALLSIDSSATVRRDGIALVENLGSVRIDPILPLESSASLRADRLIPLDSLVSVRADSLARVDSTGSVAVTLDSACPIESLGGARLDVPMPLESLGSVQGDARTPIDAIGSVRMDTPASMESLATTRTSTRPWIDSTGTITIKMDSILPLESLASTLFNSILPVDSTAPAVSLSDNIGLVLRGVQSLLANAGIVPAKAVILSLLDQPFPAAGYPQIVITPGAMMPIREQLLGGGRYTAGFSGTLKVGVWTRNATDIAYQDVNLLTSQTRGAYFLTNNLVNQLLEYFPVYEQSGLPITEDGFKFGGYAKPQRWKDPKDKKNRRAIDAGGVITTWWFKVRMSLTGAP